MIKKFLWVILVVVVVYTVWLGIGILSFRQYRSSPAQDAVHEIQGVYHIHTTYSDGTKTPDQIARIAKKANVDFIIITDHKSPQYASAAREGWKKGLLVLVGAELSVSRGHLVALDCDTKETRFSQNADNAAYQVNRMNGFSIIAHPYSKTQWDWGETLYSSGLEVINADSALKTRMLRWFPYIPCLIIKSDYFLLKLLYSPEKDIRKWDSLNQSHEIYGYYSTDAHILYRLLMSFMKLHLLLDQPLAAEFEKAKEQVFDALKHGRFYNAVDAAARAEGFRFWCSARDGQIPMGGSGILDSPVTIHVDLPTSFSKEMRLLHNGLTVLQSAGDTIEYSVEMPGTYRVEVYLREKTPLKKTIPWILSNPIFLKEKTQ